MSAYCCIDLHVRDEDAANWVKSRSQRYYVQLTRTTRPYIVTTRPCLSDSESLVWEHGVANTIPNGIFHLMMVPVPCLPYSILLQHLLSVVSSSSSSSGIATRVVVIRFHCSGILCRTFTACLGSCCSLLAHVTAGKGGGGRGGQEGCSLRSLSDMSVCQIGASYGYIFRHHLCLPDF